MDNPTKAQMWLTSIETIFRYMKEQFKESFYAKLFSASLRYAKQQKFLNLAQGDMTVEQYDAEFHMISHFAPNVVRDEAVMTKKFVKRSQTRPPGFGRAFRLTTHVDALCLTVDMSLHEKANLSKVAGKGLTPRKTLREVPASCRCGRSHEGRCLAGSGVLCYKCKQLGHIAYFCPQKLLETTLNQTSTSQQGRIFTTTR
ncbi:gag-protease polyprotein [Cucumis melo var. makuwa]|uniref:Gag-protease polyprotein n=1 Tax=Cucumis melo var. makuwa TaxID=1194695 RepID=A0A5A7VQB7_CUCMM|nr:gag-protease polyprotein [Cucumis melo var. makuwa]